VDCDEIADLLHPFADGELDLDRSLAVERHLHECPACAGAVKELQALRAALAEPALYHRAPSGLRERVRAALRPAGQPRAVGRAFPWRALAVAASLALVAVLSWSTLRILSLPSADELLARQVVGDHVRSLMLPGSLLDVRSSDRHVVKPWFVGKVTFAPPVKDLAGFELLGGRLDYLDQHKAAALVYKRRGHVINLFVWPAGDRPARPPRSLTLQGHNVILWSDGDLSYAAASDLNEEELRQFVQLVRQ
jgi:anti-sigma factor RsiW